MRALIPYLSYPLIAGGAATVLILMANRGMSYWPLFPAIVTVAIACVALLERVAPFEPAWNHDDGGDTAVDVVHFLVSYLLIQSAVASAFGLRKLLPESWGL